MAALRECLRQFGVPRSESVDNPSMATADAGLRAVEVAHLERRLAELRGPLRALLWHGRYAEGAHVGRGSQRPLRPIPSQATTLVVRNIPAGYSQADMEDLWLPSPSIHFLELGFNLEESRPASWAFLNFSSRLAALEFQGYWHGQFLQRHGRCAKALDVAVARVQGYEGNMQRVVTNRWLLGPTYWPAIFQGGVRINTWQAVMDRVAPQN